MFYLIRTLSRSPRLSLLAMAGICMFLLTIGCGTKRNTAASRNWQAFTTRYNVYFNGKQHYEETLRKLEDSYEDDYSRMLPTHPSSSRAVEGLPQPSGDFSRTKEKMQKAIQLHSITRKPRKRSASPEDKQFRTRSEFNPFLHNAWLLLGKAQYHDGDFMDAATTFLYITKNFTWLPEVVTEARLWQARCYCALGWIYEGENALHLVKEKSLVNDELTDLYNLVKGDLLVKSGDYGEAAGYIRKAAVSAKGVQKNRLWFLAGQIYARLGKRQLAYEAFRNAGKGGGVSYRAKLNARIRESEVYTGGDETGEISALKRMVRYERNREYLDQIYYALGNLYLSRGDTAEGKKHYALAVEKSVRSGIDRALAGIALGDLYFKEGDYASSQPYYSESVSLLPKDFPGYKKLRERSDVLDELAIYYENIHLQDSLLHLASLSPEEQRNVCAGIVAELQRREREERENKEREKYLSEIDGRNDMIGDQAVNAPVISSPADRAWYFYNNTTRNAGKIEFQRRWGARKLEDDWRRRDRSSFSWDDGHDSDDPENEERDEIMSGENVRGGEMNDDPHSVEYYLSRIPTSPEEISVSNDIIQEGLYNIGLILKDKLEDYAGARKAFGELDRRYPDNVYRLDVYYNEYLMAVKEDDRSLSEIWRDKILNDFPESPYGKAMSNPEYFSNLRRMHEVQEEIYSEAYTAYLADENQKVHRITSEMEREYPLSPILPKFVFIDALSYLTEGDSGRFRERLAELLHRWEDTDMTEMAAGIMKRLRSGMVPEEGGSNSRGMIWRLRLSDSDDDLQADSVGTSFTDNPESPHYLVLAFPIDSVNPNLVLYETARFNFSSFAVKDFDLEPMSFSNIGLLVIKGFSNLRELEHYRGILEKSNTSFPAGVRPVMISRSNFELLLREGRSFEEYFRYQEDSAAAKAEETVSGDNDS